MKLRPSRRDLITGAAALAAYSQIGDAKAQTVRKLLLSGGVPSWVPNRANPPDFAVNWALNQAWKKAGGLITPSALGITTTRASVKQVSDANGNWSQVAANVTATSALGRSTEEARTNSIPNNSMVGAIAGSPGTLPTGWSGGGTVNGVTQTVIGTGIIQGINYIDINYAGTPTASGAAAFSLATSITASQNQVWTQSAFLALMSGSWSNVSAYFDIEEVPSGASDNKILNGVVTSSTLSRIVNIQTLGQSNTTSISYRFLFYYTISQPINFTIRIGWPQLEQGASVTSPVVTSGTALTRAADVTTMPVTVGSAYTLFEQGAPQSPTGYSTNQTLLELSNGAGANQFGMFRLSTGISNFYMSGGSSWNVNGGSLPQNAVANMAASNNGSAQNGSVNASLVVAGTNSTSIAINQLYLGSSYNGSQFFNGLATIDAVWLSQAVPNAQLQAMV